jgi:hypothetical protein
VAASDFVELRCEAEALAAIATRLRRFGRTNGAPEWLVSGVWLCTDEADYLATASAEVLANGYVARPLNIHRPDDLVRQVNADLAHVAARLIGRNGDFDLGAAEGVPAPPAWLEQWPAGPYSTHVLLRVSERHSSTSRIACALLMACETGSLLVGTDRSTLALVLSEDRALIDRYRSDCEALSPADYLKRCAR